MIIYLKQLRGTGNTAWFSWNGPISILIYFNHVDCILLPSLMRHVLPLCLLLLKTHPCLQFNVWHNSQKTQTNEAGVLKCQWQLLRGRDPRQIICSCGGGEASSLSRCSIAAVWDMLVWFFYVQNGMLSPKPPKSLSDTFHEPWPLERNSMCGGSSCGLLRRERERGRKTKTYLSFDHADIMWSRTDLQARVERLELISRALHAILINVTPSAG